MEKLNEEVRRRLDELYNEEVEEESRVFTARLPLSLIQKIADVATILHTSKADVARMILEHGVDGVIEKFGIRVEHGGMPFVDRYDLEIGEAEFVEDEETGEIKVVRKEDK